MIAEALQFLNSNGFFAWRHYATGHFNANIAGGAVLSKVTAMRTVIATTRRDTLQSIIASCLRSGWQKVAGTITGVPDILGFDLKTGRMIAIEIKTGSDTLSADQRAFLSRLRDAGGFALVVHNVEALRVAVARHRGWQEGATA